MDLENIENGAEMSSQDLFSDEDHNRDPNFQSPKFVKKNESLSTSIISLKTPILYSKVKEETPGKACIPKTPVALLPYIAKTNISWTSDMETPKTKLLPEVPNNCNKTVDSVDMQSTPSKRLQSPNRENLIVNNMNITSPVLGGKKRPKRKVKRRILNNIAAVADTDNNNEQSTGSYNSNNCINDQVNQKLPVKRSTDTSVETTSSVSNEDEVPRVIGTEYKSTNSDSLETSNSVARGEKKETEEATDLEKMSNTSTQDFFSNLSLSAIDNICNKWAASEKKEQLNYNNGKTTSNIKLETIKEEVNNQKENKATNNISQDLLDRVAAIRRNQKSIRRSINVNHAAVPKEAFHQSALYLEQADINDINSTRIKLSQGSKKSQNINNKTSKVASFTSLASIESEVVIKNKILSTEDEKRNFQIQDFPDEMMDDWDTQFIDDVDKKENVKKSMPLLGDLGDFHQDVNFSKANGKGIVISEKNLQERLKIFEKIESEIRNGEDLLTVEKSNSKKISTKAPNHINNQIRFDNLQNRENNVKIEIVSKNNKLDKNTNSEKSSTSKVQEEKSLLVNQTNHSKKTEVLKLYEELDLNEFLAPNFDTRSEDSTIDFPTEGKNIIKISDESRLINTKENSSKNIPNVLKSLEGSVSDGFSTAGGKNIAVNDEKLNYFLNVYNELNDTDEGSLLNVKKNKVTKQHGKPTNKATTSKSLEGSVSDGFSTAGGKNIAVNDEKLNYFLNVYNELNDTDEGSLLNVKKNKVTKQHGKPTNKALIVFNNKENSLNAKRVKEPLKNTNIEKQTINVVCDSFATASGKNVHISEEKENHYKRIYDQISEDVDENSVLNPNKKKIENTSTNIKAENVTTDKQENCNTDSKLLMNNDSDEGFYNIDIEKLFRLPKDCESQPESSTKSADISRTVKKSQQSLTILQQVQIGTINSTSESKPSLLKNVHQNILKNKQGTSHKGVLLKRKLDNSEVKKPERCKSFGGFSVTNENVSASKLNRTDPQDVSIVNIPLQKGLSTSQCFDPNFDSFLSKMELSFLNNSKIKSPDSKVEKSPENANKVTDKYAIHFEETSDFFGFTFKECVESLRCYTKFLRFLDKLNTSKEFVFKVPENRSMKPNNETVENEKKVVEKRKHSDTDSDTPLTSLKKPRVGSELQGRRLFSDESDEENDGSGYKPQPVEPQVIPQEEEEEEEKVEEEENLAEKRFDALLLQEKLIRNKKRIKVKPTLGSLLKERLVNNKNRVSWSQLVGDYVPKTRSIEEIIANHPDAKILEVTASNATCYKFLTANIVGNKKTATLDVGEGALLIFNDNGHAGIGEFKEAFLAMPGVDPKLIPCGWVENHYKWIIWKLASMDRKKFNSYQLPKTLTPERVMQELKYRYDREIDRAQRPALRKILEKDDVPSRRMVLCISSITEITPNAEDTEKEARTVLGLPRWKIEATDGWYSIPLTIDTAMSNYVSTGKIKEGTKIVTYGAELLDCERGFHPLDKPPNVSLKIYSNSTRRAKWDTKLGYCMNSRPIPVKLRNIIPSGGMIGKTTAVAARVYPVLYREKTADGQSIYRNARSEEKAAIAYERAIEKKLESMYAEAQKKFESKKHMDSDEDTDNSQTSKVQKSHGKSWEMKCEKFKQQLETEVREGLPPQRQVIPVLRVRLMDDNTTVILTIWGANEDSNYDIKEGNTYTIYNTLAQGSWGGELNLKASRHTLIRLEPLLKLPYSPRTCTLIPDVGGANYEPKFHELDTVGVVVSLGSAPHGMKNFEMVNLAYPKPNNDGSSYLTILFWNGVSSFGYQGTLTVGSFVACSNLEWRRNFSWSVAVVYCSERTVFTCNPRQPHLDKEIRNLKALVKNPAAYAESCVEDLTNELSKKPNPRSNQGTPTAWSGRASFYNGASASNSPAEVGYSPSNAVIQRKLERLSQYGTSNDVSPIVVGNSARVNKGFTPVTRNSE